MARSSNPDQNPTLRARRLALELLRRREAAGFTREEAARQLEWSTSTIFRIETGRSRPQPGNVKVLLELYGVTGPERDGLIRRAVKPASPAGGTPSATSCPTRMRSTSAWKPGRLHPQLRAHRGTRPSPDRGVRTTDVPNGPRELDRDDIERRVQVRMERQRILTREDRPRLWAVLDEAVTADDGRPGSNARATPAPIDGAKKGKTTPRRSCRSVKAHMPARFSSSWTSQKRQTPMVVYVETLAGDIYLEVPTPRSGRQNVRNCPARSPPPGTPTRSSPARLVQEAAGTMT